MCLEEEEEGWYTDDRRRRRQFPIFILGEEEEGVNCVVVYVHTKHRSIRKNFVSYVAHGFRFPLPKHELIS